MRAVVRLIAIFLLLHSCFMIVICLFTFAFRQSRAMYPNFTGLEQYWEFAIGILATVQMIGSVGLLLFKAWGRYVIILSSLGMAVYNFATEVVPYPHVVRINVFAFLTVLLPISLVVLLLLPQVKVVFQTNPKNR